jgi:dTDP-4-dehydrorhamnose reductase
LFITRTDSLVGANAATVLADRLEFVGTANAATAEKTAERILQERPTWVLHAGAAAWSSWDFEGVDGGRCDARRELAGELPFLATVAEACRAVEARLTVVTSDALFRGPRMFHEEDGPSRASTPIARALVALETALCKAGAMVLRSHVYGWMPAGGSTGYAERMFHALTAELPCRVDARRHATPILATDFVRLAYEAQKAGLKGLYHLAGAERTSPYRFAAELAAALGVPGCNVRLTTSDDGAAAARLEETSLNVGMIRRRLNRPLPMLREGLARFVEQAFNGYRDRLCPPIAATAPAAALAPAA